MTCHYKCDSHCTGFGKDAEGGEALAAINMDAMARG